MANLYPSLEAVKLSEYGVENIENPKCTQSEMMQCQSKCCGYWKQRRDCCGEEESTCCQNKCCRRKANKSSSDEEEGAWHGPCKGSMHCCKLKHHGEHKSSSDEEEESGCHVPCQERMRCCKGKHHGAHKSSSDEEEVGTCHGSFGKNKHCCGGKCNAEFDNYCEECHGPLQCQKCCAKCYPRDLTGEEANDEIWRSKYSKQYCGRGRRASWENPHNYVMENEDLEEAMQNTECETGPHWWSCHKHHEIPEHHVGVYSWVPCSGGDVPDHAVKAGKDQDGGNLYVGRAWHDNDLLPAKVAPNHGGAFVPYGGGEHSKFDYEVLVSNHSRIGWQEGSRGSVPQHALVVGHTKHKEALYLGRVIHHGVMTPGKIQHSHGVLYIPWAGHEVSYDEYEVLVVVD